MNRIPTEYLAGKTREQQAEIKRLWKLDQPLLNIFRDIIKRKLDAHEVSLERDYDRPGWPYWRASQDGVIRSLYDVLSLLPDRGNDD